MLSKQLPLPASLRNWGSPCTGQLAEERCLKCQFFFFTVPGISSSRILTIESRSAILIKYFSTVDTRIFNVNRGRKAKEYSSGKSIWVKMSAEGNVSGSKEEVIRLEGYLQFVDGPSFYELTLV